MRERRLSCVEASPRPRHSASRPGSCQRTLFFVPSPPSPAAGPIRSPPTSDSSRYLASAILALCACSCPPSTVTSRARLPPAAQCFARSLSHGAPEIPRCSSTADRRPSGHVGGRRLTERVQGGEGKATIAGRLAHAELLGLAMRRW